MIKEFEKDELKEKNDTCEECNKEDKSVTHNLILLGFKVCDSCKLSKSIFPVQLIVLTGKVFSLLITKDIEIKAIIKKDKITIPKALKFDFKFKVFFVDIINPAKIQN